MANCKYEKWQREISYDSINYRPTDTYRKGDIIETNSKDCATVIYYRWTTLNPSVDYYCVGTSKYQKQQRQESYDSGATWVDLNEYQMGNFVEANSRDCGYIDYKAEYLTVSAYSPTNISFTRSGLSYKKNNGSWTTLGSSTVHLTSGDTIQFKGTITPNTGQGSGRFQCSGGTYNVYGNVMSLLYGDNFSGQTSLSGKDCAFMYLFSGCSGMMIAENLILPAKTLSTECYSNMFNGCYSLRTAPKLPSTVLEDYCYDGMFNGCSSLNAAPELPATIVVEGCYQNMFVNCWSLVDSPPLMARILAVDCYSSMFQGCFNLSIVTCNAVNTSAMNCTLDWLDGVASNGTFVKNAEMEDWNINDSSGIPSGWIITDIV